MAVDSAGNVYYAWVARNHHVYLACPEMTAGAGGLGTAGRGTTILLMSARTRRGR